MGKECKHKIVYNDKYKTYQCEKCYWYVPSDDMARLATIGANAERMCKLCEEADGVHVCGKCGNSLQLVRPGKYQCIHCEEVKGR